MPDGEGEHAVEARHGILSPGMIGFQQDLRVAVREEGVSHLLKFRTEFTVVVNGAVINDGQPQGVVHQGLLGFFAQVEDFEAPVAESCAALHEHTPGVGASGSKHTHHVINRLAGFIVRFNSSEFQYAANAAHGYGYLDSFCGSSVCFM